MASTPLTRDLRVLPKSQVEFRLQVKAVQLQLSLQMYPSCNSTYRGHHKQEVKKSPKQMCANYLWRKQPGQGVQQNLTNQ